ncbi:MAG: glycosyltransferase family 2 protein [Mariprofundaceae bacterium]
MVKIAASIVTHNSDLGKLEETVNSLLTADINIHLSIIDNASEPDYINRLKHKFPEYIIESGANRGYSFGHNIGIRNAPASQYYLVLNPDVIIHQGTLEKITDFLDAHSDIGLTSPKILSPDGNIQHLNKRLPSVQDLFLRRFLPPFLQQLESVRKRMQRYVMLDCGYDESYTVPYMSGCFMLFRRSILDKIGAFDEGFFMYLEDADITHRTNKISRAVYFPDATITHHWSRGSHRSWKLGWITVKSAFYFFNKWGWRWI